MFGSKNNLGRVCTCGILLMPILCVVILVSDPLSCVSPLRKLNTLKRKRMKCSESKTGQKCARSRVWNKVCVCPCALACNGRSSWERQDWSQWQHGWRYLPVTVTQTWPSTEIHSENELSSMQNRCIMEPWTVHCISWQRKEEEFRAGVRNVKLCNQS